jgi:hypothetical protein
MVFVFLLRKCCGKALKYAQALLTKTHRAVARQNVEVVPGPAGGSFCLGFSCFLLCAKTKKGVGLRGKAPDDCLYAIGLEIASLRSP